MDNVASLLKSSGLAKMEDESVSQLLFQAEQLKSPRFGSRVIAVVGDSGEGMAAVPP